QAGTSSFNLVVAVQPAEDAEDVLMVLTVDADAVIAHPQCGELVAGLWGPGPDHHLRRRVAVVLQPVGDQVAHELADPWGVADTRRQFALDADTSGALMDEFAQVAQDRGDGRAPVELLRRGDHLAGPAQCEQVVDQLPQASARL